MATQKKPRCPYCILEAQFRTMRVLENGRQICEHCGHIIFPQDYAFWCPCQKCVDVNFSLKYSRFFSTGRAGGSVRSRYGRARPSHPNLHTCGE